MAMGIAGPRAPGSRYGEPIVPNLNVRHLCPNCRSDPPNIIEEYSKGDLVCADCGTILGDRIVDTRSEWRTFAGDEGGDDPSRVGDAGNPLLGSGGFDTVISGRDGRSGMSRDLQRAQARGNGQQHNGQTSHAQLTAVFARIRERCDLLQLTGNIVERAQHVYKIADETKVVRTKNEQVVIAACISFATRGEPMATRSLAEICTALKVAKKDLGQALNLIKPVVQGRLTVNGVQNTSGVASMSTTVEGLLGRYVNYLHLEQRIFNAAKHIANHAQRKADIDGRNFISIASGVLYLTCILFGKPIKIRELSELAKITDSTIKLICKRVAARIDVIVRPEWKEMYAEGYKQLEAMGQADAAATAAGRGRSATPSNKPDDAPTPVSTGSGGSGEDASTPFGGDDVVEIPAPAGAANGKSKDA